MTVRRHKPGCRVVCIAFTVVIFCWLSTTKSCAMSFHEAGVNHQNKRTHTANGLEEMEISQSLEDDRPTKLQQVDAEEDGENVFVEESDESHSALKTTPSKRRLGSNKRRLQPSRFQKRRAGPADDAGEDAFDRKMREPRLRISEDAEVHLGNSRNRRSVNSVMSSDRDANQYKGGNIVRSLVGVVKRNAAPSSLILTANSRGNPSIVNDIGIMAERLAMQERNKESENIRRRLLELGKRSEHFYDSPVANVPGPMSIINGFGGGTERVALQQIKEALEDHNRRLIENEKRSEAVSHSPPGSYPGQLSIMNDMGVMSERIAMAQMQQENENIRRKLDEIGKRSEHFYDLPSANYPGNPTLILNDLCFLAEHFAKKERQ